MAILEKILGDLELGEDSIYRMPFTNIAQEQEIALREKVNTTRSDDYLAQISRHHSVPVMDAEVKRTLNGLPQNPLIIDIGGCWGWHWRKVRNLRPDAKIVIVDFVCENLVSARFVLGDFINDQVWLVHGDATQMSFPDECFDLVWSVQTFQHIPDFESAVRESYRVLKGGGGEFINYSLNRARAIELVYKLIGKKYHVKGPTETFWLDRASRKQRQIVEAVFGAKVKSRYTEILFHPDLHCWFPGRENSFFGKIDRMLSGDSILHSLIARQQAFQIVKQ